MIPVLPKDCRFQGVEGTLSKYCEVSLLIVPSRNSIPIRLGKAMKPLSMVPSAQTSGTETTEPTMIRSVKVSR